MADDSVRKVQFWLSHLTDIPVPSLSGIALPDVLGWAAHKWVVSQESRELGMFGGIPDGAFSPPPQPANSEIRVREIREQRVDCMQGSAEWDLPIPRCRFMKGQASPLFRIVYRLQNLQLIQPIVAAGLDSVW